MIDREYTRPDLAEACDIIESCYLRGCAIPQSAQTTPRFRDSTFITQYDTYV